MKDSFYLTINCQVNQGGIINLPQRIHLVGQWDVGLAEFSHPNVVCNFVVTEAAGLIETDSYDGIDEYKLTSGYFGSIASFCQHINTSTGNIVAFFWNSEQKRTFVEIDTQRVIFARVSLEIAQRLGFHDRLIYAKDIHEDGFLHKNDNVIVKVGDAEPKFPQAPQMCFIYCNFIENQLMGHEMTPLLRTVLLKEGPRQSVTNVYKTPHYVPMLTNDLNSLEIYIKDEFGKTLLFDSDTVIVKLHFVKRS